MLPCLLATWTLTALIPVITASCDTASIPTNLPGGGKWVEKQASWKLECPTDSNYIVHGGSGILSCGSTGNWEGLEAECTAICPTMQKCVMDSDKSCLNWLTNPDPDWVHCECIQYMMDCAEKAGGPCFHEAQKRCCEWDTRGICRISCGKNATCTPPQPTTDCSSLNNNGNQCEVQPGCALDSQQGKGDGTCWNISDMKCEALRTERDCTYHTNSNKCLWDSVIALCVTRRYPITSTPSSQQPTGAPSTTTPPTTPPTPTPSSTTTPPTPTAPPPTTPSQPPSQPPPTAPPTSIRPPTQPPTTVGPPPTEVRTPSHTNIVPQTPTQTKPEPPQPVKTPTPGVPSAPPPPPFMLYIIVGAAGIIVVALAILAIYFVRKRQQPAARRGGNRGTTRHTPDEEVIEMQAQIGASNGDAQNGTDDPKEENGTDQKDIHTTGSEAISASFAGEHVQVELQSPAAASGGGGEGSGGDVTTSGTADNDTTTATSTEPLQDKDGEGENGDPN